MIRLENVSKQFGDTVAAANLTDVLADRETTVLIGPSGCGKSTLLRLIVGLEQADAGRIFLDGEAVSTANIQRIRHRIGYVIQEGGLFPHLSARDNAALLVRHLGWNAEDVEARLDELAELVRLPAERLEDFPFQLSGGQRQRVSLIRALMHRPDILLLDEPLGALDPMIRASLQSDLRMICRSLNKTVVMVTHDLAEAAFFADRILLMQNGRIVQSGTLSDFTNNPADPFVAEFVTAQRATHLPAENA